MVKAARGEKAGRANQDGRRKARVDDESGSWLRYVPAVVRARAIMRPERR